MNTSWAIRRRGASGGRRSSLLPAVLILCYCLGRLPGVGAETESDLIASLRSGGDPTRVCEACRKLRLAGTVQAVPALAAWLTDERVGQAARYALEALPAPEAGTALREALGRTTGLLKAGVVDSLGWRRDGEAVPLVKRLLTDASADVAAAAAGALGRIADDVALAALLEAHGQAAGPVRVAVVEALLRCAEQRLARGEAPQARSIYEGLAVRGETSAVRVAAEAGLIRCAGRDALPQIQAALEGDNEDARVAALQLAGALGEPGAAQALAHLLPTASPAVQVALLGVLRGRGDTSVVAAVDGAARSPIPAVRKAAIEALGDLGDERAVAVLVESAASGDAVQQRAARQALEGLRRGDVRGVLLAQLATATPAAQSEIIRALTSRDERAAVPSLIALARSGAPSVRPAAWRALSALADESQAGVLVELLASAPDDEMRNGVVGVFESMAERGRGAGDLSPVWRGAAAGDVPTRRSLLRVCALFPGEPARRALRTALKDPDEGMRDAAGRALAETRDVELLPDLLAVARSAPDSAGSSLALAAVVRLAAEPGPELSEARRTELLSEAFGVAARVEDKRQVLSGLARVPNAQTLELVRRAAGDVAVKPEAEAALLQITQKLGVRAPFIEEWAVSGPYRKAGVAGAVGMFDLAFGPEIGGETLPWRPVPRAPQVALASLFPGQENCAAYLRTQFVVPQAGQGTLLLGSDDGVKAWVNGALVHANNVDRGDVADQDKVSIQLRAGTNTLMLKISQGGGGWSARARVVGADGQPVPGLQVVGPAGWR